ncbi:MAG: hypothetical protein LBC31_07260 [Treponema sp.]|jgi:hypothetical protein|nr:hypothetical protein [Treponema sp.]
MASSALSLLSGVAAAAAGLAGDKLAKNGTVPGLDLASIVPALLGKAGGSGAGGLLAGLASAAAQSGLLDPKNLGSLAELAGTLLSAKAGTAVKKAGAGIPGLAAAIAGGSGSGTDLGKIAALAAGLAKSAKSPKDITALAADLGKTLSGQFGVSLNAPTAAVKGLGSLLGGDTKAVLFQTVLKGLL